MKNFISLLFKTCLFFVLMQNFALANYSINETWSKDLRSQVTIECSANSSVCQQLCNDAKICVVKNSTCKDCISTGVKMTYFFSTFGKDINSYGDEVSIYEFIDFLTNAKFIAFSSNTIYNQFDSAQSDALATRFKAMCPNSYEAPMAFFEIQNRELDIRNAKYVTCGDSIYRLEINSSLLK